MNSAALLRRMGFSADDRVVVLHADDIGMCQATVSAYREISARGILASASAMVPCGWFPAVANLCSQTAGHDMGVHLTLTSEWPDYRWGPLLGAQARELCDEAHYFHPVSRHVQEPAARELVYSELKAQVQRAQRLGIDVTHIDSHMFTLMHPMLGSVYADLSREFRTPCVLLRFGPHSLLERFDAVDRERLVEFDAWAQLPLDTAGQRLETARRLVERLPPGLSYFISHPAVDGPELRAIAPDWEARVADYKLYLDDKWANAIAASGIKVIGMRPLRAALFGECVESTESAPRI